MVRVHGSDKSFFTNIKNIPKNVKAFRRNIGQFFSKDILDLVKKIYPISKKNLSFKEEGPSSIKFNVRSKLFNPNKPGAFQDWRVKEYFKGKDDGSWVLLKNGNFSYVFQKQNRKIICFFVGYKKEADIIERFGKEKHIMSADMKSYAVKTTVEDKLKKQMSEAIRNQKEIDSHLATHSSQHFSILESEHYNFVPTVRKNVEKEEFSTLDAGAAQTIGGRPNMEDAHLATEITFLVRNKHYKAKLFGVFDGHGDDGAIAKLVADNLGAYIRYHIESIAKDLQTEELTDEVVTNALTRSFVQINRAAQLHIMGKQGGTTATCALVIGDRVYVPNVGDSRTILVRKNGDVNQLSEDAKPADERFKRAVTKAGGFLKYKRVGGNLAIARDIGMKMLGLQVSPRPKITCSKIEKGDILVLACDGLFDLGTSSEVGRAVLSVKEESPQDIAQKLAYSAVEIDSDAKNGDNVSVVVAKL